MANNGDPFRHHPELRDKIAEPLTSRYRNLDLTILDETMMAAGAQLNWRLSEAERESSRRQTLNGRSDEDLWIFAYGSLMWDPAFRFGEVRTALLKGFRRSFCLRSVLGRGTPEKPGLMAALDHGGECGGLVFQIDRNHIDDETRIIWQREMLMHAYVPGFVSVQTPFGTIEALTFIIDQTAKHYCPGMSLEQTARYMATGVGLFGSSFAYIENLARHFEAIGIEDRALSELYGLARQMVET